LSPCGTAYSLAASVQRGTAYLLAVSVEVTANK